MKRKKVVLDSLNVANYSFIHLFDDDNYSIETVKSKGIFEPKRWLESFGKLTSRHIVEAKILHTSKGLTIPLKRFGVNPEMQTIEFAGLYGYNEKSKFKRELLKEYITHLQDSYIKRLDVAIDYNRSIPTAIIKRIFKYRKKPFKQNGMNTNYFKTLGEGKTNPTMDIKIYDKSKQLNLNYYVQRLEFCFKGAYFEKLTLKDIDIAMLKMEKSIKRFTGLNVKISSI